MRHLFTAIYLSVLLSLGTISAAWSADFQKGYTAYKSGDFATALREWTPLAKQGNASAQKSLGAMYFLGQGVIQDYVYAHMWGNIAASNGSEEGGKLPRLASIKLPCPKSKFLSNQICKLASAATIS